MIFDFSNKNYINANLLLKYKKFYILLLKYKLRRYKKLFFFRKKVIKLKFMDYKYSINNILGIKKYYLQII